MISRVDIESGVIIQDGPYYYLVGEMEKKTHNSDVDRFHLTMLNPESDRQFRTEGCVSIHIILESEKVFVPNE